MTDAFLAAALLAVDPLGSGVLVRGRSGPARDEWLAVLRDMLGADVPFHRLPAHATDDRLLGGLELTETLRARRPVVERGLLARADGGLVVVPMAERLPPSTAGHLAAALDNGVVVVERDGVTDRHSARFGVAAFDESLADDEAVSPALADRMALQVDLADRLEACDIDADQVARARDALPDVVVDEPIARLICETSLALGVGSVRADVLAMRIVRAHAALAGRRQAEPDDVAVAARLVLAPRATRLPLADPPEEAPPPDSPEETQQAEDDGAPDPAAVDAALDMVLAAAQAALPPGLLGSLGAPPGVARRAQSGRAGQPAAAAGRGRPIGVRPGRPGGQRRLNLVATLRAAAPWQGLRGAGGRIEVRPDDFRIARLKQRRATTTVFVVDASGSAALSRLAEAKGAVELLLADCYVRRDEVALIAFRGRQAEIVVPPTRSLVRAKRCLSGLPGGGATPLAAAIDLAAIVARAAVKKGRSATVVVLTDGKANMTRAGRGNAAEAEREAQAAARAFAAGRTPAVVVDTSARPRPHSESLAQAMNARYLPLPHAGARELSAALLSCRPDTA